MNHQPQHRASTTATAGRAPHSSTGPRAEAGPTPRLRIDDAAIRHVARQRGPRKPIAVICCQQACAEFLLRVRRGIAFRRRVNGQVRGAYIAMNVTEFEHINASQAWSNWRTIPRSLNGRLPDRPLTVVDLCCGSGCSTAVLACHCPPGSRILGLDSSEGLIASARARSYVDRDGRDAAVRFAVQNVLEVWRDDGGNRLADESMDLINATGAFGCHFTPQDTARVAAECARILRPGGYAAIDAGRVGTTADQMRDIFAVHRFKFDGTSRSCALDRYRHVCMRKAE